jgi:hypothetical protein
MGERRGAYGATVGKPDRIDNLEDVEVDGKIILDIKGMVWESVDWIDLSQVRERWRADVKTVMNIRVP